MKSHYELTDSSFEAQFASCTLDPALFNHEAHLRLAWIHITRYGIEKGISNISDQLKNFTNTLGAGDKYNETVTVAAIRAVYHFILKSDKKNFSEFITANPRLKFNFKDLIEAHYSINIFNNAEAKKKYLEPDRLPFD